MRIGEMAQQLGLTSETLRYYERRGLLPAPARNGGRYRDYTVEDAKRLRLLVGLRQLDLPLPVAAKLATMCADGQCGQVSDDLRAAIPAERSRLRRRISELRHVDQRLAVLERELRAGQGPRELIRPEPRKEDVRCAIARAASAAAARPAAAAANAPATARASVRARLGGGDRPQRLPATPLTTDLPSLNTPWR